jgi:hypothetical protein
LFGVRLLRKDPLKDLLLLFPLRFLPGVAPDRFFVFAGRPLGSSSWTVAKSYRRECLHCNELFDPNLRNRWHQKFCGKPECRKASKAQSQRRWLSKPQNRDHFRGAENVDRVRQWRKAHPGYWKRSQKPKSTLQDLVPTQPIAPEPVAPTKSQTSLQDLLASQDPLLLGLIAHLIDSPLQDHIEHAALDLLAKGRTFLDMRSRRKTTANDEDQKTNPLSGAPSPHSRSV